MPKPRPAPPITAGYLFAVTARYLSQRSTSASHLRRLLLDRARRSPTPIEEARVLIDAEIDRLVGAGLLDDARYAQAVARSRNARGVSEVKIRGALSAKGLSPEVATEALRALDEVSEDPQGDAARTWARKRRLGPWRVAVASREEVARDLARMGRAGFPYAVARRVLSMTDPDEA